MVPPAPRPAERRGCRRAAKNRFRIAIPKAGRRESQKANLEALTISLDDEDRAAIAALPKDQRFVRPPFAPEWDAVV
jgi:diketogulonate reductase-like aldo/keto reductase